MIRRSLLRQHIATVAQMPSSALPPPAQRYDESLDSAEIDPNPDFRVFLRVLNVIPKIRTVSSSQGHGPGEKYPDVTEPMAPYVTIVGSPLVPRDVVVLLAKAPYVSSLSGGVGKKAVTFRQEVDWREVRTWLIQELLRRRTSK